MYVPKTWHCVPDEMLLNLLQVCVGMFECLVEVGNESLFVFFFLVGGECFFVMVVGGFVFVW